MGTKAEGNSTAWEPLDEVIVTSADHEANRGAWLRMASRMKLQVKCWHPAVLPGSSSTSNVGLSMDDLESLITPKTRLVAFTASSNVLGSHFTDEGISKIAQLVKKKTDGRAYVAVDAVAFAPHMRLRPEEWGVDFVVWSWYKVRRGGAVPLFPR